MTETPVHTTLTIPGRGHQSIHADALFDGFLDLTCAYRFGPPGHDVVAATLRDRASSALRAGACFFPGVLPAERAELGLTARVEPAGERYELILETQRFAHAVAIDIDGWSPDDNYLHLEPGEQRRIALRSTAGGVVPRGVLSALNGCGDVPLFVAEAVDARR